jgi:hypothetical protein
LTPTAGRPITLFTVGPMCCLIVAMAFLAVFLIIFTTIGKLPEDDKPPPVGDLPSAEAKPDSEPAAPPG